MLYIDPGTGALVWQVLLAGFLGSLFYVKKVLNWFSFGKKSTPNADNKEADQDHPVK